MARRKESGEHTPDNTASQEQEGQQETAKGKKSEEGVDRAGQPAKPAAAAAKEKLEEKTKEMAQTTKAQAPVQRMRKYNIRMLIASIAMLMILCGILLFRIRELNNTVADIMVQLGKATQLAVQQEEQLQKLTEELAAAMENGGQSGDGQSGTGQNTGTSQGDNSQQGGEGGEEITAAHKVYLTFDDGPSTNTQKILDILDQYDVKATFFVLGKESDSAKESLKKIVEAGHTLAMHSYTHKYSDVYESVESFAADFAKEQEYLYDVTGVVCNVYRFPGGSSNTVSKINMKDCAKYLDSQGVRFFDWNISSGDGGSYLVPVETLVENCTKNISKHSTSVILMHDSAGKSTTVEALPTIIETILEMEDTVILPITDETTPIQHIKWRDSDTEETDETKQAEQ